MTDAKLKKNLEAIAGGYEIKQTPGGNFQAVTPSGETLATARTEALAANMAEGEFARRRTGARCLGKMVRLGNTTRDIVL